MTSPTNRPPDPSRAAKRFALIGSVNSSVSTLQKLHQHGCEVRHVFGLDPEHAAGVSGYRDLAQEADSLGLSSQTFRRLSDPEVSKTLQEQPVDVLMVVGLSQLVSPAMLALPRLMAVGYHPTQLPKGRGRGALAWLVLGKAPGAATLFQLDAGMDSGPILAQVPYAVREDDYVEDVLKKGLSALDRALDQLLPKLLDGSWEALPQDHSQATFLGRRKPQDGFLDFSKSASELHQLIRASSSPLPGAWFNFGQHRIVVDRAQILDAYIGVPGRIVDVRQDATEFHSKSGTEPAPTASESVPNQIRPIIACGVGALQLTAYRALPLTHPQGDHNLNPAGVSTDPSPDVNWVIGKDVTPRAGW